MVYHHGQQRRRRVEQDAVHHHDPMSLGLMPVWQETNTDQNSGRAQKQSHRHQTESGAIHLSLPPQNRARHSRIQSHHSRIEPRHSPIVLLHHRIRRFAAKSKAPEEELAAGCVGGLLAAYTAVMAALGEGAGAVGNDGVRKRCARRRARGPWRACKPGTARRRTIGPPELVVPESALTQILLG